jgi:hypothetical protein
MTAADRKPSDPPAGLPDPLAGLPDVPAGLRARVLEASRQARAAGRPVPAAPEISAAEAFSRAADAFYGLLCALSDDDWRTPVLRGLDVQGLVGHLIGVEHDMHRCLSGDPDVADAGHVGSTQATALRQAGRPPGRTRAAWRRAASRTLSLVSAGTDADAVVALYGMRLPLRALLVVRAFELWTHENDIRRAVCWPASAPDASTLSLMTDLAVRLLPSATVRAGPCEPVDVHLVLTGPGGGTWDVTVGGGPSGLDAPLAPSAPSAPSAPLAPPAPPAAPRTGAPVAVAIVTDAVGFCRLAANRVTPAELDMSVTGDPDRVAEVLAAACTLALD